MSDPPNHNYVSTVYTSLIEPITVLYKEMVRHGAKKPTGVHAAPTENGYAVSLVALTTILVEDVCNRARHFAKIHGRHSVSDTFRAFGSVDLADKLDEVFVVRDALTHGHLWVGNISNNVEWTNPPILLPGYGDGKFERLVDPTTRTTRQLGLDVVPTRIHRGTATVVLKESANALYYLESKDKQSVNLSSASVHIHGYEYKQFYRWVEELPT